MIRTLAFVVCFAATFAAALAQQPTLPAAPQLVPADQRIASQIGNLVILNATQGVKIDALQAELAAAQARVKELEAKAE